MPVKTRSLRQEQRQFASELRGKQKTWAEIAAAIHERYGVNMRVGLRLAHGWSQREAAETWNARWPAHPKTFKSFSYWEQWPAATGHSPSLEVLTRLAALYGCSIADLLNDCADFRSTDEVYRDTRHIASLPVLLAENGDDPPMGAAEKSALHHHHELDHVPYGDLLQRLHEVDVHELARLVAEWADRLGGAVSRRALLLKLSAGLSLAAASPALAAGKATANVAKAAPEVGELSGVWHSRYSYRSSGRAQDLVGEHYVRFRQDGKELVGESLPAANGSILRLDLTLSGSIVTGTWSERTAPEGYYRGAVYHGVLQLILDPLGKAMRGKWLGFDKQSNVNSDVWELTWIESAATVGSQRKYHRKA